MTHSFLTDLALHASQSGQASEEQARFNALIRSIETRRQQLLAWSGMEASWHGRFVGELAPLNDAVVQRQRELLCALDARHQGEGTSLKDRRQISSLIMVLFGDLGDALDIGGTPRFKHIYNRHSATDYDEEVAAQVLEMKSSLEQMLGSSLGDDIDLGSSAELMRRARSRMDILRAREEALAESRAARREKRRSPSAQADAQRQRDTLQSLQSQSLREAYRRLASALHPDREPDPVQRSRKTALMQDVNLAYEKKDLLRLLELQWQMEQIDLGSLSGLNADRLRAYIRLLQDQLSELDRELLLAEDRFRSSYGIDSGIAISPATALSTLEDMIREMQQHLDVLNGDLAALADEGRFKRWLKEMKQRHDG